MNPLNDLFTAIAHEHLGIATLESSPHFLEFHKVDGSNVKDALLAAYQAGQHAAGAPEPLILLQDIALAMHEGGMRKPKAWLKRIDRTIAEALAALPPIVAITVRGGLIEDMDATLPLHVVVEDWDITDDDTGEKPARNVWKLGASLSAPRAQRLRRLIAND